MHSYVVRPLPKPSKISEMTKNLVFFPILTNFGVLLRLLLYSVGFETWHGCSLARVCHFVKVFGAQLSICRARWADSNGPGIFEIGQWKVTPCRRFMFGHVKLTWQVMWSRNRSRDLVAIATSRLNAKIAWPSWTLSSHILIYMCNVIMIQILPL